MDLYELRRANTLSVYQCILNGVDCISAISKNTGISMLTVSEIANDLTKREILNMTKPQRNVVGRRIHRFKPSHKYYSIFIDRQDEYFSTIGISTEGLAVERFDYPINYEKRSSQEVLDKFVLSRVRNSPNYRYCMAIYIMGAENDGFILDDDIIITNKEDLIAVSLAHKDKLRLFDFNGKTVMSLYSHIQYPSASKDALSKFIQFDEIYSFSGDFYSETFDALKRIAKINLENMI